MTSNRCSVRRLVLRWTVGLVLYLFTLNPGTAAPPTANKEAAPAQKPKEPQDPPERMLANIEARKRVSDSDPRIAKIRTGLARADNLFKEDVIGIMDMTYNCWKEITQDGQRVTMQEILDGSLEYAPSSYFKRGVARGYDEYVAFYLTVRIDIAKKEGKPKSHKETIKFLKDVTSALTLEPDPKEKPKTKPNGKRKPRR